MTRISAKAAARDARRADTKAREALVATADSFANFGQQLGLASDSPMAGNTYTLNPLTRNRTLLEFMHRGSWLAGLIVDAPADDMTRAGVEYVADMAPEDTDAIDAEAKRMGLWPEIRNVVAWGRLYGGALGVVLIDGQDVKTPLRPQTIQPGQFKGLLALDRWMVDPTLDDLVTEPGPHLGKPRYYRVQANAPALRGCAIHYSRVLFRIVGTPLPYNQSLTENLWGLSVLERPQDRIMAFDAATTGASQLLYKSFWRTLKIEDLRSIVAAQGKPYEGLLAYVQTMRRYQGIEGVTLLDSKDELEVQGHQAMSGMSELLVALGQQVSGAVQIPLVRLFGQSPTGLNSTGESDMRIYYDGINKEQETHLSTGVNLLYRLLAVNQGVAVPKGFGVDFRSLYELTDEQRGNVATSVGNVILSAHEANLLTDRVAMRELRQLARRTGVFSNIQQHHLDAASDQVQPPEPPGMPGDGLGLPGLTDVIGSSAQPGAQEEEEGNAVRPQGQPATAPQGAAGRIRVQPGARGGGEAG